MKTLIVVLSLVLAAPAWAGTAHVVSVRKAPRDASLGRIAAEVAAQGNHRLIQPRAASEVGKLEALSCENDGVIAGALEIGVGDFAGNVFEAPQQTPWQIKEITFGLFDLGATFPGLLFFDVYVADPEQGGDFFVEWSLDIEISDIAGQAETFTVDVSMFDMEGENAILTLYGDGNGQIGRMLPAYDNSARCFDGDNVCSVHLPANESELFIYGLIDLDTCPTTTPNPLGILNYDLVHEVVVGSTSVDTTRESWGALKTRY